MSSTEDNWHSGLLSSTKQRLPGTASCPLGSFCTAQEGNRASCCIFPQVSAKLKVPLVARDARAPVSGLSLYKILFHFKPLLWESVILVLPPPLAKPTLLQYHCTTIAQYTPSSPTPLLYAIHHTILVMGISCKDQVECQGCG